MTVPLLSVIIPCRNEACHIRQVLDPILCEMDSTAEIEVIVIDGMSTDGTWEILQEIASRHPQIRILRNERHDTAVARNIGIKAAGGKMLAMIDGHSQIPRGYLMTCCRLLGGAPVDFACVAGRTMAIGETFIGKAIALAMSSRFGVGGASFRCSDKETDCSTAAFGVYRRSVIEQVGGYDESMLYAEDDELSLRITSANYRIRLVPQLAVKYWVRNTFLGLWKQYFRYGIGKMLVFQKQRRFSSWFVLIPPLFVTFLVLGFIGGLFSAPIFWAWLSLVGVYLLGGLFSALSITNSRIKEAMAVIGSFICMHIAYGAGLLFGLAKREKG
jgi:cellulose synthase/poly-beta-1,6-N-acetylglucosamine synthase-like glycosyltransferase